MNYHTMVHGAVIKGEKALLNVINSDFENYSISFKTTETEESIQKKYIGKYIKGTGIKSGNYINVNEARLTIVPDGKEYGDVYEVMDNVTFLGIKEKTYNKVSNYTLHFKRTTFSTPVKIENPPKNIMQYNQLQGAQVNIYNIVIKERKDFETGKTTKSYSLDFSKSITTIKKAKAPAPKDAK